MCFSPQRRAIFRHQTFKKCSETFSFLTFWLVNVLLATAACNFFDIRPSKSAPTPSVFLTFWLVNVLLATAACNFSTSDLQKVLRHRQYFSILTWKRVSRHSSVQFLRIRTSKSAPNLTCFVHFHCEMCFSPQRRAIFAHQNFKKCSEPDVFCTFSLRNVLCAAWIFCASELQKVLRTWRVLYIFTSKCALRGVQFLRIRTSKGAPNLTCFVHFHFEMCFARRAIFAHQNFKRCSEPDVFCTFSLRNVLCEACNFCASELQKVLRTWRVLYIFTSKCALRGVQFLRIRTSKGAPNLTCFVHFHFEMCFARRAIFAHQNFKRCSEPDVFCTFSLRNVLCAACNFCASELQKALRTWRVLYILTSKCALRGVQFLRIRTSKGAPNLTCFVHFHFEMCFARRAIFAHQNFKRCSEPDVFCTFSLRNVLCAACNFCASELQKVLRTWRVLYIFTSKCALRGVQFLRIRTSKGAPNLTCFVHFHFEMCFARRAIFAHQNFKRCSEPDVFCTFSLRNVLCAGCNFCASELQKVLRTWRVLYIFTSKCALRGVQFLRIRTSKGAPNLTCFVHFHFEMCFARRAIFAHQNFKRCSDHEVFCSFWLQNVFFATAACNFWFLCWAPTSAPAASTCLLFNWPDTQTIEKTQHFATSLTFGAHVSSFLWLSR